MPFAEDINYDLLPPHMQHSVREYIEKGHPVGNFLRAVLENKLVESFGRADQENLRAMYNWASFLYNEMPCEARGSKEAVDAWIKKGGLAGHQTVSKVEGVNPNENISVDYGDDD